MNNEVDKVDTIAGGIGQTDQLSDSPKDSLQEDDQLLPTFTPSTTIKLRHRTANKSFHIISNKDDYKTFINADCQLNHQFYPLYPNNKTIFVLQPGEKVTNFGHMGFPATNQTKTGGGPNKNWKIVCRRCLGVTRCSNVLCTFLAAPPTGIGKLKDKLTLWVHYFFLAHSSFH